MLAMGVCLLALKTDVYNTKREYTSSADIDSIKLIANSNYKTSTYYY